MDDREWFTPYHRQKNSNVEVVVKKEIQYNARLLINNSRYWVAKDFG